MAINIVTPFAADDAYAGTITRLRTLANAWLGEGTVEAAEAAVAASGLRFKWNDYYALVNPVLTAAGKEAIEDEDDDADELVKINTLNDAEQINLGFGALGYVDAARTDLITKDGSNFVSSITDIKTGSSYIQATGSAQPLYEATGLNGGPCLKADGTDDRLTLASQPFPSGANASEFWALVDQEATAADGIRQVLGYGSPSGRREMGRNYLDSHNRIEAYNGTEREGTSAELLGVHLMRVQFSATDIKLSVDGVQDGSGSGVPNTGTMRVRLFANVNDTVGQFWKGRAAVLLIMPALSTLVASYVTNYLKYRGGL